MFWSVAWGVCVGCVRARFSGSGRAEGLNKCGGKLTHGGHSLLLGAADDNNTGLSSFRLLVLNLNQLLHKQARRAAAVKQTAGIATPQGIIDVVPGC